MGEGGSALFNPQLATFLRVADAGSFNKAAEELFISPSAVIKQINLLEKSLGVALFARSNRGLTLMPAGAALELSREPIRCALPVGHPLANRERLTVQDLHGERFMLIRRGWNSYLDILRDNLWRDHPQIEIVDFDFLSMKAFNRCESENCVMMTIDAWRNLHPMLRMIPVDWPYAVPFGVLHALHPSPVVARFLDAVRRTYPALGEKGGEALPDGAK